MSENIKYNELLSFLSVFADIELPVTLSSEYVEVFSKYNKPIPENFLIKFIIEENYEDEPEVDDEYIACLKLPTNELFHAIVYLKIGILKYEYILQTFDLKGEIISKQLIASMTFDGEIVKENVALIDEDLIILIMEGNKRIEGEYNPKESSVLSYELDEHGNIKKYKI